MKALISVLAFAVVGSAVADHHNCAHCGASDKFTMTAMSMAANAAAIPGDPWGTDCKMACCSKDGHASKMQGMKHGKHMKGKHGKHTKSMKRSKKAARHH